MNQDAAAGDFEESQQDGQTYWSEGTTPAIKAVEKNDPSCVAKDDFQMARGSSTASLTEVTATIIQMIENGGPCCRGCDFNTAE